MATDKRKQRLQNLQERLDADEDIAVRDLKNALTEDEFRDYDQQLDWQRQSKSLGRNGSSGYDDWFKKGLFHHNKAESGRFSKAATNKFHNAAQDCFGKALEQLESDMHTDASVQQAYDRQLDFSERGSLGPDIDAMPRRIDSKSLDNLHNQTKLKKRDLKIQAVKSSLANFDNRKEGNESVVGKERKVSDGPKVSKVSEVAEETVKNVRTDTQGQKLRDLLRKLNNSV